MTIEEIFSKLESDYGTVESKQSVMKKFYSSQQMPDESVEKFASRIEELFDQAVKLNAFKRTETDILQAVLYDGLNRELRHMSSYLYDKIKNYDEFKRELRKIEVDLRGPSSTSKEKQTCKATINIEKKESNEIGEMKELLRSINDRITNLEKQKESQFQESTTYRGRGRGFQRSYGRGQGRGFYRPQRPLARGNFIPTCNYCGRKGHLQKDCYFQNQQVPTCYSCNQKGHLQRNCPILLSQTECHLCKEKGHKMKDCPKA